MVTHIWKNIFQMCIRDRYEPIKWRVLNRNGNDALLLADVALDDQKYNTDYAKVTWETSSMRSWLNGYGAVSYTHLSKNRIQYGG